MREKLIKSPLKRAFVLFSIISLLTYLLSPIIIVSDAFLVKTTFVSALCKVKSSKQNIEEEGSQSPALTPLLQTQIREAIALSTKSSRDINAAYQAANTLWPSILYKEDKKTTTLGPKIELLCRALYATTLTQIGRDKDAVDVYNGSILLAESQLLDVNRNGDIDSGKTSELKKTLGDVRMGCGRSLQRLMRYREASKQFKKCADENKQNQIGIDALCSSALCLLRLNNSYSAYSLLKESCQILSSKDEEILEGIDGNVAGMLGILKVVLGVTDGPEGIALLKYASEESKKKGSISILYQWLYAVSFVDVSSEKNINLKQNNSRMISAFVERTRNLDDYDFFLQLAAVNQSPFDEPALVHLDDKVLLNQLLSSNLTQTETQRHGKNLCWPKGFILPQEKENLLEHIKKEGHYKKWILKERAGYGSHGNSIIDVRKLIETPFLERYTTQEPILCQQLIDPPLLINGKKFSLRLFVLYFSRSETSTLDSLPVYISSEGLIKIASAQYNNTSKSSNEIHMTNSGCYREGEESMTQFDFNYLRKEIGKDNFLQVWDSIKSSVACVMKRYKSSLLLTKTSFGNDKISEVRNDVLSSLPKIMGFDYIIDTSFKPWLMEVNRFPGLEPRGKCDKIVKQTVLRDAWGIAAEIYSVEHKDICSESEKCSCCFEEL